VRRAIDDWFASLGDPTPGFAIADIPLLYETARDREFDVVIVTACDPGTQVTRIMKRDGISEADARARLEAQLTDRREDSSRGLRHQHRWFVRRNEPSVRGVFDVMLMVNG
jgi:dephospho-CoA kinase